MGKIARRRPMARVSRSGLWLIGGGLLLSVAVLAWALQTPAGTTRVIHRPMPAARSASRIRPARKEPAGELLAARPPSVTEYESLLQGNVFQPRVVPPQSRGAAKGSSSGHPSPGGRRPGPGANGGPVIAEGWHDWRYNGIAQLDQQTYALMDQPDKKQSQFVKVGDHLEDATIIGVAENAVTLREADGTMVRVKQVDTLAEQLRSARAATATTPVPAGAAPAAAGSVPSLVPGQSPGTNFPSAQGIPQGPSAAPSGGDGSLGRRGRRSQQLDGAGSAGGQ